MNETKLARRIAAAFHHGEILSRELRLSGEEAQWLAAHYPARLSPIGEGWYQMEFLEAFC